MRKVVSALIEKLSRVSVSTRFVPEIDGLRFFAIGSVVLYHMLGVISVRQFGTWQPDRFAATFPLNWLIEGHFGVPLFFAISGFVLALPFADHHLHGREVLPLPRYYLRRLARLGPPYVINLVFLFLALVALGHLRLADWPHLLASFCYVHDSLMAAKAPSTGSRGRWKPRCSFIWWRRFSRWPYSASPARFCGGRFWLG